MTNHSNTPEYWHGNLQRLAVTGGHPVSGT